MARHRRRRARSNPTTTQWLIGAGVVAALGVGAYVYLYNKPGFTPGGNPVLPPAPNPANPTPQHYSFSSNSSGGNVTLNAGDSISFSFPNDPAAATTANKDWFWTTAPLLGYSGRTTQVVNGQLVETDTFTYGGGQPGMRQVIAQFLSANAPALPTGGPNPPVAYAQAGASTFTFNINTT